LAIASASSTNGIRQATGRRSRLRNTHAVVDVGEHGGLDEISPIDGTAKAGGSTPPTSMPPLLGAHLDIAPDFFR